RWNKPETIAPVLEGAAEFEGRALANAVVFDAQRKPIATFEGKRFSIHGELAQEFTAAIEQEVKSGKIQTWSDGSDHYIMIAPVVAGKDREYVGALAVALSLDVLNAVNAESSQRALVLGGGLLRVLLAALMPRTPPLARRPLRRLPATTIDPVAAE